MLHICTDPNRDVSDVLMPPEEAKVQNSSRSFAQNVLLFFHLERSFPTLSLETKSNKQKTKQKQTRKKHPNMYASFRSQSNVLFLTLQTKLNITLPLVLLFTMSCSHLSHICLTSCGHCHLCVNLGNVHLPVGCIPLKTGILGLVECSLPCIQHSA